MVHELKTWKPYFQMVRDGDKQFELRKNDRDFKAGDGLVLREYDNECGEFTGRSISATVMCVIKDVPQFGLMDGYCIMGIEPYMYAE
jgi:ASC-1-like (ASCH) protein